MDAQRAERGQGRSERGSRGGCGAARRWDGSSVQAVAPLWPTLPLTTVFPHQGVAPGQSPLTGAHSNAGVAGQEQAPGPAGLLFLEAGLVTRHHHRHRCPEAPGWPAKRTPTHQRH